MTASPELERERWTIAEVAVPTGHAPEPLRGVAALSDGESLDELLARADKSLYEAKHTGRNRVVGPTVRISRQLDGHATPIVAHVH